MQTRGPLGSARIQHTLWGVLCFGAAACSKAPHSVEPSGGPSLQDAGTFHADTTSATTSDAGGDARREPSPSSWPYTQEPAAARAACRSYIEAWCGVRRTCGFFDDTAYAECLDYEVACPDRFFLPGTGYTLESLDACTHVWETFDCTALAAGTTPDCVQAGTRAAGQTCRFDGQCASQLCSIWDGRGCGVCLDNVGSGAACELMDQCPAGHVCERGRCLQLLSWQRDQQVAAGAACAYDGRCTTGTLCAPDAQGDVCTGAPALGAPCLPQGSAAGAPRCPIEQYCASNATCQALPQTGEACVPGLLPCHAGEYCDSADGLAPGTCRESLRVGSACDPRAQNHPCLDDAQCRCVDAACTQGMCLGPMGRVGECLGDAGASCPPSTVCEGGLCVLPFPNDPSTCEF